MSLVSDLNLLKRQLAETRDSLDKMAILSQSLAKDKRELNTHILQVLLPVCLPVYLSDFLSIFYWLTLGATEYNQYELVCVLQMEAELSDGQDQIQVLKSEVTLLQRNLTVLRLDYNQLK